jgi:hypothetical protein
MQAFDDRHEVLPPELQAATREFDEWSQARLLIEQNESTPSETLFHYTGEDALRGILATQRLWCFSHLHQRDRTEFAYSLNIARRIIKQVGQTEDFFTHHFCGCLDDLLETNSLVDIFEFYLFSLSRHRDDRQQWMDYGAQGRGFAIGFAPALFQPDQAKLNEQANENLHVGRVIYGDGPIAKRHRRVIETAAEITSRIGNANLNAVNAIRPGRYLNAMAKEVIASQLVWNCLTAKNIDYENEREVRYLIMNVRGQFDAHRKNFNGKHYIEAALPLRKPGSLTEILVGPLAPLDAAAKVAEILKEHGYPEGISISRSAISARPPGSIWRCIARLCGNTP